MIHTELLSPDLAARADDLLRRAEPFAIATVIRTAGATAAKPGARALLDAEGTIREGWIGGGCVRTALRNAVRRALAEGTPQLISLAPEAVLKDKGLTPGDVIDGVRFARNGCPSEGSIEIFVEPVLQMPELVVYGASPVARALILLAAQFAWTIITAEAETALPPLSGGRRRMIVVATQGQDDRSSLEAALGAEAEHVAFVGSRRKFAALAARIGAGGGDAEALARVESPAGLDIRAVTPEEIALSILARLTQLRRGAERPLVPADAFPE